MIVVHLVLPDVDVGTDVDGFDYKKFILLAGVVDAMAISET